MPSLRAPLLRVLYSLDDEDRLRHPRPEARKAPEGFGISWARRTWSQELVTRESNGLTLSATTRYRGGDAEKRTGKSEMNDENLRRSRIPSCRGWACWLVGRLPWLGSCSSLLASWVCGLWSRIEKVTKTGDAENSQTKSNESNGLIRLNMTEPEMQQI